MSTFAFKLKIDSARIQAAAKSAMEKSAKAVSSELFAEMQAAIGSKVWEWPRQTVRSNGGVVGSPRNIKDTGLIQQTGKLYKTTAFSCEMVWSAGYSTYVHEGAWIFPWGNRNAQRVLLPARPWTRAVTGQQPQAGIPVYDYRERMSTFWKMFFKL